MKFTMISVKCIPNALILIYFLLSVQPTILLRLKQSPCPATFIYEEGEPDDDRWYGDIILKINQTVEGASFRITLDKPSELLVLWTGPVTTADNKIYIGYYADATLIQGSTYKVRIMVKFDRNKAVPLLESLHLNGVRICPIDPVALGNIDAIQTVGPRPELTVTEPTDINSDINKRPNMGSTTKTRPTTSSIYYVVSTTRSTIQGGSNQGTFNSGGSNSNDNSNTILQNFNNGGTYVHKNPNTDSGNFNQGNLNTNYNQESSNFNNFNTNTGSGGDISPPNNGHFGGGSINSNQGGDGGTFSENNSDGSGSNIPCGTVSVANPLITNGQKTYHGQWPWHVALYKTEGINLNYLCGGSLISKNKIITAAHCLVSNPGNKIISYKSLIIYLGKHNLRQYTGETGVQTKEVSRMNINPLYNSSNFQGDIAILTLSSDIEFTNYVRPVCTWEESNSIEDIKGKEGVVAGWGLTEYDQTSEELKMASLPVVSTETCLRSYPKFYSEYLSDKAFCAGFRNGTSPCNGDSGGGLVFKRNNSWYLRGIVSLSVAKEGLNFCDPNYYVIFTDSARFVDFIRKSSRT